VKTFFRWVLSAFMLATGIGHFLLADEFIRMVPTWLPEPALLVAVSGVAEIAGAIGLQIRPVRRFAAWGLILLYIAVFPANVHMAMQHLSPVRMPMSPTMLWARLPFQALLVVWAWWNTRPEHLDDRV
jgi:uncharacterized membrane protein